MKNKLLIVFMILSLIVPTIALAEEEHTFFNCGKKVEFSYKPVEYNGKFYINEKDLIEINLFCENNMITDNFSGKKLCIKTGSSFVEINNVSVIYKDAYIFKGNELYLSLDLLCSVFSKIYEKSENETRIWISDRFNDGFICGTVSLPNNDRAGAGGVSAEVFAANVLETSTGGSGGGGGGGFIGLNGQSVMPGFSNSTAKPVYNKTPKRILKKLISKTIVIPEGCQSCDYSFNIPTGNIHKCVIGYSINNELYYDTEYTNYNREYDRYNFTVAEKIVNINGKVKLPKPADKDVAFTIEYENGSYNGVIYKGEISADYNLRLKPLRNKTIHLIFTDGEYMRENKNLDECREAADFYFNARYANEYNAVIKLPDNYTANECIDGSLYIQSFSKPHYRLGSASFSIQPGEKSVSVRVLDDMDCGAVICFYVLHDNYNGLYKFGHYINGKNCTTLAEKASSVSVGDEINISLMKRHLISGNVNVPIFSLNNCFVGAIALDFDDNGGETVPHFRTDVDSDGKYSLSVPEEFEEYILMLCDSDLNKTLYYATPSAAVMKSDADTVTALDDLENISFNYDGYRPSLPIRLNVEKNNYSWNIMMSAEGDFDVENVVNYIALYDESGKLLYVYQSERPINIVAGGNETNMIALSEEHYNEAREIKLFTVSDFKPVAKPYFIKKVNHTKMTEKNIATMYIQKSDKTVYSGGKKFDAEYLEFIDGEPYMFVRDASEILGLTVLYDDSKNEFQLLHDSISVRIKAENKTAIVNNDKQIQMEYAPVMRSGRLCIPITEAAQLLCFSVKSGSNMQDTAVYDDDAYAAKKALFYELADEHFDTSLFYDSITRLQAASLIVNLYESINGEIIPEEEYPFYDTRDEVFAKANQIGIMRGFEDGSVRPDGFVTNAEMIYLFKRTLEIMGYKFDKDFSSLDYFIDYPPETDHWARDGIYEMKAAHILDNVFKDYVHPDKTATVGSSLGICAQSYLYTFDN